MTCYVNRFIFYHVVQGVKLQCIKVTTKLTKELQAWFLQHVLNEAFIFVSPTIGHLQIVMSFSIIMSMLWSFYFAYQRRWRLVRLNRWSTSFCVHLTWICINLCSRWWWKTVFELLWAFLIVLIFSLKCEGWSYILLFFFATFHNMLNWQGLPWFECWVLWKMNECLVALTSLNLGFTFQLIDHLNMCVRMFW
jgi:hypothetical protein